MKTGIIYCYLNPINGKRYIGQTTDERSRRSAFKTKELYCTKLGEGGKLSKFDAARKKYGIDSFVYTVLCKIEDLTHKFQTVVEVRLKQPTDTFGNLRNKLWLKEHRKN